MQCLPFEPAIFCLKGRRAVAQSLLFVTLISRLRYRPMSILAKTPWPGLSCSQMIGNNWQSSVAF